VEYVVEAGNTLSSIISAHNAAFKEKGRKTSLQLILDANPGLKPTTMQVGRKLFIPMVPVD
jgi:LysM repeat protein